MKFLVIFFALCACALAAPQFGGFGGGYHPGISKNQFFLVHLFNNFLLKSGFGGGGFSGSSSNAGEF